MTDPKHYNELLADLRRKLRDINDMHAIGSLGYYDYLGKRGELLDHKKLLEQELKEAEMGKRGDDVEQELVKNIICAVLQKRMKMSRCEHADAYQATLTFKMPREVLVTGSVKDSIRYLERIRNGLNKLFEDTIQEIKDRNRGYF